MDVLYSLVSVLLPVYNGEATVREAIESVLAQDYPNFEFIIVDNASTDGTAGIIREYISDSRIRLLRNETTLPRLDNFVKSFNSAAGESHWLKFVGDDDRLLPTCLTDMVSAGEKSSRTGLITSYYYDGDRLVTGVLPEDSEVFQGPQLLRRLLLEPETRSVVFSPASLMVSHRAYLEMRGFRTDLLHADSELFYRILNSYDLAFVHKALTITGYHSGSGQAGSTARGFTFKEAYLIRYHNLKRYDNVVLSPLEREKVKNNLVTDSTGFMLTRLAAGDFRAALKHLSSIPPNAIYHLPLSIFYFAILAVKKLMRRDPIRILKSKQNVHHSGGGNSYSKR